MEDGVVVNHPYAVVINEEILKKITEFEHILIAMHVNKDDMTITQFKTFDDVTLQHIYQFDLFIREEQTYTTKGKPIVRS